MSKIITKTIVVWDMNPNMCSRLCPYNEMVSAEHSEDNCKLFNEEMRHNLRLKQCKEVFGR